VPEEEQEGTSDKAGYVNRAWLDRTGVTLMPVNGR